MKSRVFVVPVAVAALALAPLGAGCGPVLSTSHILTAEAELQGAQAAGAEKYAPYEYTAAREYLHKAREEQGFSDFAPSITYAEKAIDLAKKGIAVAAERKDAAAQGVDATPASPDAPKKIIIQRPADAPASAP